MRVWVGHALVALAGLLAACTTIQVSTDFDPGIDFGALETYAWLPDSERRHGDPRIDNTLLDQRVRSAVDRELEARGFRILQSGTPDFLVTHFAAVDRRIRVDQIYRSSRGPGWGQSGWSDTVVNEYEQGTLLLDVLDPRSRNLMWRGTAAARLGTAKTPEQRTQRVNEAVERLLDRFPPD